MNANAWSAGKQTLLLVCSLHLSRGAQQRGTGAGPNLDVARMSFPSLENLYTFEYRTRQDRCNYSGFTSKFVT